VQTVNYYLFYQLNNGVLNIPVWLLLQKGSGFDFDWLSKDGSSTASTEGLSFFHLVLALFSLRRNNA
jgi:hypothetical protein